MKDKRKKKEEEEKRDQTRDRRLPRRNIDVLSLFWPPVSCGCLPLVKTKWKSSGASSLDHLPIVISLIPVLMVCCFFWTLKSISFLLPVRKSIFALCLNDFLKLKTEINLFLVYTNLLLFHSFIHSFMEQNIYWVSVIICHWI